MLFSVFKLIVWEFFKSISSRKICFTRKCYKIKNNHCSLNLSFALKLLNFTIINFFEFREITLISLFAKLNKREYFPSNLETVIQWWYYAPYIDLWLYFSTLVGVSIVRIKTIEHLMTKYSHFCVIERLDFFVPCKILCPRNVN